MQTINICCIRNGHFHKTRTNLMNASYWLLCLKKSTIIFADVFNLNLCGNTYICASWETQINTWQNFTTRKLLKQFLSVHNVEGCGGVQVMSLSITYQWIFLTVFYFDVFKSTIRSIYKSISYFIYRAYSNMWGLWRLSQVSREWISNYIPQNTVGCNYSSMS